MSDRIKLTTKDTARIARLCIETARMLRTLRDDIDKFEDGANLLGALRYEVRCAADNILRESISLPDIKIAVFSTDEATEGK